jgi:hypothetical protein
MALIPPNLALQKILNFWKRLGVRKYLPRNQTLKFRNIFCNKQARAPLVAYTPPPPLSIMAGLNFQKTQVALCTASTLCYSQRWPMPAHHNLTAQITQQRRLAHDDNTVAYFFCGSCDLEEAKH